MEKLHDLTSLQFEADGPEAAKDDGIQSLRRADSILSVIVSAGIIRL